MFCLYQNAQLLYFKSSFLLTGSKSWLEVDRCGSSMGSCLMPDPTLAVGIGRLCRLMKDHLRVFFFFLVEK